MPILQADTSQDEFVSYATHVAHYQEAAALSASPGQLVVMLYDHALLNLRRARMAMERGDVEQRGVTLDRARNVISELLSTLDAERGGEVANNLSALYVFLFGELVDLGMRPDVARLERVTAMVSELRDAFAEIAATRPSALEVA